MSDRKRKKSAPGGISQEKAQLAAQQAAVKLQKAQLAS
ncbi:unnamed protein product, partial [Chrysoparadoxa australica]